MPLSYFDSPFQLYPHYSNLDYNFCSTLLSDLFEKLSTSRLRPLILLADLVLRFVRFDFLFISFRNVLHPNLFVLCPRLDTQPTRHPTRTTSKHPQFLPLSKNALWYCNPSGFLEPVSRHVGVDLLAVTRVFFTWCTVCCYCCYS